VVPHDVFEFKAIAVENPDGARGGVPQSFRDDGIGGKLPVCVPKERVEFDVRPIEQPREGTSQSGFTGAGRSDDDYAALGGCFCEMGLAGRG
jgi:hypothetical protein